MNNRNYQKELDRVLDKLPKGEKTLYLHSCCAPCSSYVLEYLKQYFRITVFYYNPNISASEEYRKRVEEQKRLIAAYNEKGDGYPIDIQEGDYDPASFFAITAGYEDCAEGEERCFICYEMRLRETALRAKTQGYDYFCTTLSISPLKNAIRLNEIGEDLEKEFGIAWLPSDFKKRNGYKRSVELSKEYDLYRQNFCGCSYSKAQAVKEGRCEA